jgi:hypothetical protein
LPDVPAKRDLANIGNPSMILSTISNGRLVEEVFLDPGVVSIVNCEPDRLSSSWVIHRIFSFRDDTLEIHPTHELKEPSTLLFYVTQIVETCRLLRDDPSEESLSFEEW